MAEDLRVTNMPDSGSPAAVALKLLDRIGPKYIEDEVVRTKTVLDLYAQCLEATRGIRKAS